MVVALLLSGSLVAFGSDNADMQQQIQALQKRIAELEVQQSSQVVQQRNAELIRQLLKENAADVHPAADTGVTAGYDKRFFIKSTDDQFRLEIGTGLQFRHSYLFTDDGDSRVTSEGLRAVGDAGVDSSSNGFELERARLLLKGHVLKNLQYLLQIDLDDDSGDGGILKDFWVAYSFIPEFGVKAGRFKSAFGKQETTSYANQMFVDRSLANEVFNIGRGTGAEVFGDIPVMDTKANWRVSIVNGFHDERNSVLGDNDNNPAVAARLAVPMLGATTADFVNESDLEGHDNLVSQIGTSFAYGNNTTEGHIAGGMDDNYIVLVGGGDGLTNGVTAGGEITMVGLDWAMKYQGLSVNLEGFFQHADLDSSDPSYGFANQFGWARDNFGVKGYELDNYGWIAQAGYFVIPGEFELVSRVSGVCVEDSNDSYEYAGGWNYYINGQDVKLSMDVSYIDDVPVISSPANIVGVQNNSLLLVRTQLQFQF